MVKLSIGKKRTKRFLGKKETATTTAKPPIAGAPLPQTLTATVPPPFLFDTIEAIVEGVDACKPYIFSIKIYSPRNAVMGEIEGNWHDLSPRSQTQGPQAACGPREGPMRPANIWKNEAFKWNIGPIGRFSQKHWILTRKRFHKFLLIKVIESR